MNRLLLILCLLVISVAANAQKKDDRKNDKKKSGKVAKQATPRPDPWAAPKPVKNDPPTAKSDTIIKLKESPKIEVTELVEYMSQGQRPGLKVIIPTSNVEVIEKDWKAYIKTFKGKTKKGKEEYFTDNATILRLSNNPVDIYSRIEETANGTSLKVFFDLGGAYLSSKSNAEKYPAGEGIVREFASHQAMKGLVARLDREDAKLLRLAESRKNLETEQQLLELDIERMKETIRQNEQTLEKNKAAKIQLDSEIQKQITAVEQLKKDIKVVGTDNK